MNPMLDCLNDRGVIDLPVQAAATGAEDSLSL